jgi:acyl CoA:acetate/3-ketoacid CoA transferase beta subunit
MTDATRAEVCAAACADLFLGDGEIMASPMGLIPTIGARLAKLTSSPDLLVTDGEALILGTVPALGEKSDYVEGWMPFRKVFEVVAHGRRHVIMGATQIDRHGNQNISAIGDFAQPTRQLLGVRGAPGNTVNNRTSYWVPRQSARAIVERVDIVSGIGWSRAQEAGPAASRYNDIHRLVTNLGVYDFSGDGHSLRLLSVHPGVTVAEALEESACAIQVDGDVAETRSPTDDELRLIREVIDPRGLREREVATVPAIAT